VVAGGGARGHADHAVEGGRHAQAEAGEEGGEDAAGDEGHDDEEEDLPGVALGVVDEVADDFLELLPGALHEVAAGGALVVGGAVGSKEARAAAVAAETKEGGLGGVVLVVAVAVAVMAVAVAEAKDLGDAAHGGAVAVTMAGAGAGAGAVLLVGGVAGAGSRAMAAVAGDGLGAGEGVEEAHCDVVGCDKVGEGKGVLYAPPEVRRRGMRLRWEGVGVEECAGEWWCRGEVGASLSIWMRYVRVLGVEPSSTKSRPVSKQPPSSNRNSTVSRAAAAGNNAKTTIAAQISGTKTMLNSSSKTQVGEWMPLLTNRRLLSRAMQYFYDGVRVSQGGWIFGAGGEVVDVLDPESGWTLGSIRVGGGGNDPVNLVLGEHELWIVGKGGVWHVKGIRETLRSV
jgi:hypothetical protein